MRRTMRNRRRQLEELARDLPRGLSRDADILEVAQLLWKQIDTPLSLGLSLLCKNGQFEDALRVEFDPARYVEKEWETARDDYQAIAFLRKMPLSIDGIDRSSLALEKFLGSEQQCHETNLRFRTSRVRGFSPRVDAVLSTACRKISYWLGDLNAKSWALRCRFGPGSDTLNKGTRASSFHKLSSLSVTTDFIEGAQALVLSHPVWARTLIGVDPECQKPLINSDDAMRRFGSRFVLSPGNRVTFVPKTALVDRSIAIEPGMNIFAQLGLGALIRARLKKVGLDLDDQYPNQVLARQGSVDGSVATIDLSSASDTLATEVVRELLPPRWFLAMDWVRSKKGIYRNSGEDVSLTYEKFSSMGNGFTFELESMIFYALALSCGELMKSKNLHLIRSYGDDITVPAEVVTLLEEVLSFCGFSVNPRKSYSSGVFRESCGADFFNGRNVRPYFHKEYCKDASSIFRLANGIRRVAYRRNVGFGCDRKLYPLWVHVVSRIPCSLRDLRIPYRPLAGKLWADIESGDGGLASNLDEALSSPFVSFNRDYQAGWNFAELQAVPASSRIHIWPEFYLYAMYRSRDGITTESTSGDRVVHRGENRVRLNDGAYAPSWLNLGPWA
jgi:hypothetical protein